MRFECALLHFLPLLLQKVLLDLQHLLIVVPSPIQNTRFIQLSQFCCNSRRQRIDLRLETTLLNLLLFFIFKHLLVVDKRFLL